MAGQSSKPDRDGEGQDAPAPGQSAGSRSDLRKLLTKDQEAELRELRETRNETRRVTVPALEEMLYEAIDSTGAGDVFNGVLSVALGEGKTPAEAVRVANAAAALSVMKMGAQPSAPDRAAINAILTNHTVR